MLFTEWYESIGNVTRAFFVGMLVVYGVPIVALLLGYKVPVQLFAFDMHSITEDFQLWRLVTSFFFFGPLFSLKAIVSVLSTIQFVGFLEGRDYYYERGHLVYLLLVTGVIILAGLFALDIPYGGSALRLALIWVWSRHRPHSESYDPFTLSFLAIPAPYTPFVLALLDGVLQGESVFATALLGFFAGNVFFFINDYLPLSHGIDAFTTPSFLRCGPPGPRVNVRGGGRSLNAGGAAPAGASPAGRTLGGSTATPGTPGVVLPSGGGSGQVTVVRVRGGGDDTVTKATESPVRTRAAAGGAAAESVGAGGGGAGALPCNGEVIELTPELYAAAKADSGLKWVMDAYTEFCGPCKALAPRYRMMAKQLGPAHNIAFTKVDINAVEAAADDNEVMSVPWFVLFKGGKAVASFDGPNVKAVEALIKEHLCD